MSRRRRVMKTVASTVETFTAPVVVAEPVVRRSIAGGCTVTTRETASEAVWAAVTFHTVHSLPVLIVCDRESLDYLQQATSSMGGIVVRCHDAPLHGRVRSHNRYHRPDAIALKMKAMQFAIEAFGDAVFFDADLTFLGPLPAPDDAVVMLSPNWECFTASGQHGRYNAGLVWSCSVEFCDWWLGEYLSGRSSFYEQSALDLVPAKWRTSYFGPDHNHGFWRGPIAARRVDSIHCHLSTTIDHTMSGWMLDSIRALRAEAFRIIHHQPILTPCLPYLPH